MADWISQRISLPPKWRSYVRRYGSDRSYWYVPKGLAVSVDSLKPRLRVLEEFEGSESWRECQAKYIRRLNKEGISEASSNLPQGGAALARMLKQVFVTLGLAWVDPDDLVEITPAGTKFLESNEPDLVLSEQLSRYQFWNPSVKARVHREIRVHPIPFLGEILRNVNGQQITREEYTLFVSRAKSFDDVDAILDLIHDFRQLSAPYQLAVSSMANAHMLGGAGRTSIYNTIRLGRSYALRFFALSNLIEVDEAGTMRPRDGALREYRSFLNDYRECGTYIDFQTEKEWIAYFGDPYRPPLVQTALDYYVQKGDVAAAVAIKRKQGVSKSAIKEFRDMMISERQLEDQLEHNLDVIGRAIGSEIELVGRQYSTTVGPIDLLCREKKRGGSYVVVELKKGRGADRVFGQLSRYMGWVRKNLSKDKAPVRGVIVARRIDDNLKAARAAHDTDVALVEFQVRMGASAV